MLPNHLPPKKWIQCDPLSPGGFSTTYWIQSYAMQWCYRSWFGTLPLLPSTSAPQSCNQRSHLWVTKGTGHPRPEKSLSLLSHPSGSRSQVPKLYQPDSSSGFALHLQQQVAKNPKHAHTEEQRPKNHAFVAKSRRGEDNVNWLS